MKAIYSAQYCKCLLPEQIPLRVFIHICRNLEFLSPSRVMDRIKHNNIAVYTSKKDLLEDAKKGGFSKLDVERLFYIHKFKHKKTTYWIVQE